MIVSKLEFKLKSYFYEDTKKAKTIVLAFSVISIFEIRFRAPTHSLLYTPYPSAFDEAL